MRETKFRGSLKIQSYEITGTLEDSEFLGGLWVRTKGVRKKKGAREKKRHSKKKGRGRKHGKAE